MLRLPVLALALTLPAAAIASGAKTSTIAEVDPVAGVLTLTDRTIYEVEPSLIPDGVVPGDVVTIRWNHLGDIGKERVTAVEPAG